jgi:hypothetical protein
MLNVSPRTLLTNRAAWGLSALKLGKAYQFKTCEVLALLDGTL